MSDQSARLSALAALPAMFPGRLRALLGGRGVEEVWSLVVTEGVCSVEGMAAVMGRQPAELARRWRVAAAAVDLAAVAARDTALGVVVLRPGDARYPPALAEADDAPEVLFARGDLAALGPPAVAIVGTRQCTHAGREIARWLGRATAEAGAVVVSGLALGIDGAAHTGALEVAGAPVAGVVGSGLDRVYPRRHRDLWDAVAKRGVLLSETPAGLGPVAWRFPARNRIIASLAAVVVVVESHGHGGSLVTARLAAERGRSVLAVPGSIRSPASAGTNALLRDGAAPLLDLDDLVVAMSLAGAPLPGAAAAASGSAAPAELDGDDARVWEAVSFEPVTTEQVIVRSGLPPGRAMAALRRLEAGGRLTSTGGGRWERR